MVQDAVNRHKHVASSIHATTTTTSATTAAKGTHRTETVDQQQHGWEEQGWEEHARADTALQPSFVWVSAIAIMCTPSIGLRTLAHKCFIFFFFRLHSLLVLLAPLPLSLASM